MGQDTSKVSHAISNKDVKELASLLEGKGGKINTPNSDGQTPLHLAVELDAAECVNVCMEHGADVNCKDKDGWAPLHFAALFNRVQCASILLQAEAIDLNVTNSTGWTPLHVAAWRGHKESIILLAGKGAGLLIKNHDNQTPSELALRCKEYEIADLLKELEVQKESNQPFRPDDRTTTMLEKNSLRLLNMFTDLEFFPEKLADINHMLLVPEMFSVNTRSPKDSTTMLHYAVVNCSSVMVDKLLSMGADPKLADNHGLTPLHWATYVKNEDHIMHLVRHGALLNPPIRTSLSNSVSGEHCTNGITVLHLACFYGDLPIVKILVEAGALVTAQDPNNNTQPLHWAAMGGHVDILEYLIQNGASIKALTSKDWTSLHIACYLGHIQAVELLLEHGSELNAKDAHGQTPLDKAILGLLGGARNPLVENGGWGMTSEERVNKRRIIKHLIERGADLNSADKQGITPLMLAAIFDPDDGTYEEIPDPAAGKVKFEDWELYSEDDKWSENLPVMRVLIAKGANIHATDNLGETALHKAAFNKRAYAAALLLENGAEVNVSNKRGVTPFHCSAYSGNMDCIYLLVKYKAEIHAVTLQLETALHFACLRGHVEAAMYLLDCKIPIDSTDAVGDTPLHKAMRSNHTTIAKLLITREGHEIVNAKNSYCETPLHYAAVNGCLELIKILKDHGAAVDEEECFGNTPLHGAAYCGNIACLNALIEPSAPTEGAKPALIDINAKNKDNCSPLHVAVLQSHFDATKVLVYNGAEVNAADKNGNTPLHAATRRTERTSSAGISSKLRMVTFLIENGADVDSKDKNGWTTLHIAAKMGSAECAQILLDAGAKQVVKNSSGLTAADVALEEGFGEVATLIKEYKRKK